MGTLPVDQLELLVEISETEPVTAPQLSENMRKPVRGVRALLRALELRGLVWRDTYQQRAAVYGVEDDGAELLAYRREATS